MEFTPIETQEQLDEVIKNRIARERAKFADYDELKNKNSEYEKQFAEFTANAETSANRIAELEKAISDKDASIKARETELVKSRVALECGLPLEMATRLSGETEEEIKADAEKIAGLFVKPTIVPPLRNQESEPQENGVFAAFKKLNPNLKF